MTLAVSLGLAVLLGAYLWQLKPLVLGPGQISHSRPSPRIAGTTWVGQAFYCRKPNLTQVRLLIGTFYKRKFNPTRFQLLELARPPAAKGGLDLNGARLISEQVFSRSRDNRFLPFSFPAQAESAGKWYLARLSPTKQDPMGSIIWWLSPASLEDGRLVINGRIRPDSTAFKAFYLAPNSKTADLLRRLSRERPTWLTPAAGTSAGLLAWLAALFLIPPVRARFRSEAEPRAETDRPGRRWLVRAALLGPPLLIAAAWGLWFGALPPHGLEAEYHQGHRLDYPVFNKQSQFTPGAPGRRRELRPHFDVHDIKEMGLNPEKFSVRYTGRLLVPRNGKYRFELESGGWSSLVLGGRQVVEVQRADDEPGRASALVSLKAGPVDIEIVHRQYGRGAWLQTRWGPPGGRLRLLEGIDLVPPGVKPGRAEGLLQILAALLAWLGALCVLVPLAERFYTDVLCRLNRPEVYLPLSLALIGLLVRLIYVFQAQSSCFGLDAADYFHFAWDQSDYLYLSHGIQKGFWPWLNNQPLASGPAPAYLLAAIGSLLGRDILILRLVMSLSGLLTGWIAFATAKRIWGLGAGWLAMALIIWSGSGLVHEAAPLIAGPMALFMALTARYCIELTAAGAWVYWARAGLALGLVLLLRGNALIMAPVLGLTLMFLHRWRWPTIRRMSLMAGLAALVLLIPSLWNSGLLGNRLTEKVFAPSSAGPNTLWIGNNPRSKGHNILPPNYVKAIRAKQARHQTSLGREVVKFITNHPLDWLKLMWTKLWMFFNGHEYPNNLDYYNLARSTPILNWGMFNYALLCPLALAGLVLSLGWVRQPVRGRKEQLYPLLAIWGGYALAVITFFVLGRFRVPLYPILALFATFGLKRLLFAPRKILTWSLLFIVFYLACNWDQFFHPQAHEAAYAWQYWALEYAYFLK